MPLRKAKPPSIQISELILHKQIKVHTVYSTMLQTRSPELDDGSFQEIQSISPASRMQR